MSNYSKNVPRTDLVEGNTYLVKLQTNYNINNNTPEQVTLECEFIGYLNEQDLEKSYRDFAEGDDSISKEKYISWVRNTSILFGNIYGTLFRIISLKYKYPKSLDDYVLLNMYGLVNRNNNLMWINQIYTEIRDTGSYQKRKELEAASILSKRAKIPTTHISKFVGELPNTKTKYMGKFLEGKRSSRVNTNEFQENTASGETIFGFIPKSGKTKGGRTRKQKTRKQKTRKQKALLR